jgi:pyridoxamine 5'-phosphate oxidase
MDITDYVKFANENPVTYVGTVEGDQPRVRAFAMWFADKTGFYYHTGTTKEVCKQLKKNPKVELCFYKPGEDAGTMMRVTGKVEFIEDQALMDRLFQDRPWMKEIMKTASPDSQVAMFRVAHGDACFWTMADNMREHEAPHIKF